MKSALRVWIVRLWRAAALAGLALLTGWQQHRMEPPRTGSLTLEDARTFFPQAAALSAADHRGVCTVYDAAGEPTGSVLRTAPFTDHITGYSGPHDLLVALGKDGAVSGLRVLHSADTPDHLDMVLRDPHFLQSFTGWKPGTPLPATAVGGATLTSASMAESLQHRLSGGAPSLRFTDDLTLAEVRSVFPQAAAFTSKGDRWELHDAGGALLGMLLRSSPASDDVMGYRGPTETLIALQPDGRTIGPVAIRKSYDTESYVARVRSDETYLQSFRGRTVEEMAALDFAREGIEGVSGATQTSWAIAEGLRQRMAAPPPAKAGRWLPAGRDWLSLAVVAGALLLAFTPLRGKAWCRTTWQALLMVWALWTGGDLVSIALLAGWAGHGIPWSVAPGAALIVGAALFLPWLTRRQVYCHQICPHGAAQQWLGKLRRHKWQVRPQWDRALQWLPWLLLATAVLLLGLRLSPAALEPFDAWVWRAGAVLPLVIAVVGLVLSIFIPQAYCRYGCPTGALLSFMRSTGSQDRFGRRDLAFAILLAVAAAGVAFARPAQDRAMDSSRVQFSGQAMGTTWQLTVREATPAQLDGLETAVAARLEEIENDLSLWRPDSALSRWNAAATTAPAPLPPGAARLVRLATGISGATGGAFDITAGPLVRRWGFGPPPRPESPPDEKEIAALLAHTGWDGLTEEGDTLARRDAAMQIDLTALTEGYAAEEIAALLKSRGHQNFLINLGGELLARGTWPVAVERPLRTVLLQDATLATAGTYRQERTTNGQRLTHLIDPRTGRPVSHSTVSVSVRHPDGALADAWATALAVLGVEEGLAVAEQWEIAAEFITEDPQGHLHATASPHWQPPPPR